MLYSSLLGKTKKEAPKEETSLNAQLLIKAGYIQKEMAGVYAFLPLGWRVMEKVMQIIREEMEAIGGQEIFLGSLQNPELWKKTDRWNDAIIDVWFKTKLKNGTETGLAPTHEEPLTSLATKYVQSYKDLPFYAFQFQNKFRNETRAKSGLLRTREFIMKDLYSFNRTEEELEDFYEISKESYHKIFERAGIGQHTYITFASGGIFSKYSHEFQTVCPTGEDTIYLDKNKKIAVNKEVYSAEILKELGIDPKDVEEVSAIEVGNIFKLVTRFSDPLNLVYTDIDGTEKPVIMGSYGIGPGRLMATIVEINNDDKGIVWPENVAPYQVHLVGLNLENKVVRDRAFEVYDQLVGKGVEVLFDDRPEISAGEKFSDADLVGIPYRAVVSQKTGEEIEVKKRNETENKMLSLKELLKTVNRT
jgi:prolyl-tRNA synthetase